MKFSFLLSALLLSTSAHRLTKTPERGLDEKPKSDDLYEGSQGSRDTDKLSTINKIKEDDVHQGSGVTSNRKTGGAMDGGRYLPQAEGRPVGPINMPKHLDNADYAKAKVYKKSQSGLSHVTFTMSGAEESKRFIKLLF